jgi:hypothetical protein
LTSNNSNEPSQVSEYENLKNYLPEG